MNDRICNLVCNIGITLSCILLSIITCCKSSLLVILQSRICNAEKLLCLSDCIGDSNLDSIRSTDGVLMLVVILLHDCCNVIRSNFLITTELCQKLIDRLHGIVIQLCLALVVLDHDLLMRNQRHQLNLLLKSVKLAILIHTVQKIHQAITTVGIELHDSLTELIQSLLNILNEITLSCFIQHRELVISTMFLHNLQLSFTKVNVVLTIGRFGNSVQLHRSDIKSTIGFS